MTSDQDGLKKLVAQFEAKPVTVIGDIFLDKYIWGTVDRVSPEAPVLVVKVREENMRLGGAANVVNNLVALGAKVSLCGVVGDDAAGQNVLKLLSDAGVDTKGVVIDSTRPTIVKTRVIAHSQQVVRVDREEIKPLPDALKDQVSKTLREKLSNSASVVVSDYGKGVIGEYLFSEIRACKEKVKDLPVLVDPKAPHFDLYKGASIIKPNRKEAEQASGISISTRSDAIKAGEKLIELWQCQRVLITLGELGMVLVSRAGTDEPVVEIDTVARKVFDVSGAGDTVSAVFALALAAKSSGRLAAELSNIAAGIVVGEVGTVAISKSRLLEALHTGKM